MYRQIILASNSKARAGLLKKSGFRFKVRAAGVKEVKYRPGMSVRRLVIYNSCLKAKKVMASYKNEIIIAADTVVLQNKMVFGKPRDKKEAFRIIKRLSSQPSFVYTGLAVADCRNNKIYTDCEITKVWMLKLSDSEINEYLSIADTKHLSFAGGFDIQGRGSLFIERIDGCFYNVVGLPLAKLHKLLKKCAIGL